MRAIGGGLYLVCDADGLALGLPRAGRGTLGDFFVTQVDGGGGSAGLTPAEVSAVSTYLAAYRRLRHPGSAAFEFRGFASLEAMQAFLARSRFDADHAN